MTNHASVVPLAGHPRYRPVRVPTQPALGDVVFLGAGGITIPDAAPRRVVHALLDLLLDRLDAHDAATADMEPDHDGEAEADEASAQSATLAGAQVPARLVRLPVAFGSPGSPVPQHPPVRVPVPTRQPADSGSAC